MTAERAAGELIVEAFGLDGVRPDHGGLVRCAGALSRLPYENATKILRREAFSRGLERLRLPHTVLAEHLALGAGGTCFSLTEFARTLFEHAGFRARPLMADMPWGADAHCAVEVLLDGEPHLVDPGYLLARPLPLHAGASVRTARGEALLEAAPDGSLVLVTLENGQRKPRYRLQRREVPREEFIEHWLDSFELRGLNGLVCSRMTESKHVYLHNHRLRVVGGGGHDTRNVRDDVASAAQGELGLDPELVRDAWRVVLQRRDQARRGG